MYFLFSDNWIEKLELLGIALLIFIDVILGECKCAASPFLFLTPLLYKDWRSLNECVVILVLLLKNLMQLSQERPLVMKIRIDRFNIDNRSLTDVNNCCVTLAYHANTPTWNWQKQFLDLETHTAKRAVEAMGKDGWPRKSSK